MTVGLASVQLPSIGAAVSQERDVAGSVTVGKTVSVGLAHERNLTDHVLLDTGHVVVPGKPIGLPTPAATPPRGAERLLYYLLPRRQQADILGDLAEMYADTYAKFGPQEARRLYWWHATRSIAPVLRRAAAKWSIVAAIAELLRRTFGS
jgi:hypothetical protein